MIELDNEFTGTGEVKDFVFKQIKASNKAYVYEVNCLDIEKTHYETFLRKESKDMHTVMGGINVFFPAKVKYPNSSAMGKTAWTFRKIEDAIQRWEELNNRKEKTEL